MTTPVLRKRKTLRIRPIIACGVFLVIVAVSLVTRSRTPSSPSKLAKGGTVRNKPTASNSDSTSLFSTIKLSSGLEMPAVGYGTCCRPSAKGKAIYESTKLFLKNGGKLIDTAMAYDNHKEIGRAVRDSVPRDHVWITSKIAPNRVKTYEQTLTAVDGVLAELGMDHLDLLLIHSPKLGKKATVELWKGLIEAKKQGKVNAIGVSNFNRLEIEDLVQATGEMPEVNQIQFHPWTPPEWKAFVTWGKQHGVTTIAYTSLGGSRFHRSGNPDWPDVVDHIATSFGVTPAQVLLQWALRQGVAVIPGATTEAHILENLQIPNFDLTDEEAAAIENAEAPPSWFDAKRGPFKVDGAHAETAWVDAKHA